MQPSGKPNSQSSETDTKQPSGTISANQTFYFHPTYKGKPLGKRQKWRTTLEWALKLWLEWQETATIRAMNAGEGVRWTARPPPSPTTDKSSFYPKEKKAHRRNVQYRNRKKERRKGWNTEKSVKKDWKYSAENIALRLKGMVFYIRKHKTGGQDLGLKSFLEWLKSATPDEEVGVKLRKWRVIKISLMNTTPSYPCCVAVLQVPPTF